MEAKILADDELLANLDEQKSRYPGRNYGAMYSSWFGGITTNAALMTVPLDDHIVHRGDGIFEAFRMVDGAFYNVSAHLERLKHSAAGARMDLPIGIEEIGKLCRETAKASGLSDAVMRLFISRGPGGFSTNPYECVGNQIYIAACPFKPPRAELYSRGARAGTSSIPPKTEPFCSIKSCNYLNNVLMKKEAVDLGLDSTIAVDENGHLTEGAIENFFLIDRDRRFVTPRFEKVLQGTTLIRLMELARDSVPEYVSDVVQQDLLPADLADAVEAGLVGTSLGVLPLVEFDGKKIGGGSPGPLSRALNSLIEHDMRENEAMRTPVL